MKVPYSWLKALLPDLPDDPAEVAERLSDSGTYVEAVHADGVADATGAGGEPFRIGVVRELEQHPDADKLRVAKVDVGDGGELQQIVCGAPNVAAGETVAVVLPGGVMPDGLKIKPAKLRGVESRGMLMSERELGLSTEADGIMLLDTELEPGAPLSELFPIGDHVLELEITGNRPDCLGVLGVAREAATAMGVEMIDLAPYDAQPAASGDVSDHVSVDLQAPDLCPRYMARAFVDVEVGQSPQWLKAWLTRAGMRPINNVVDVTNYVMLFTGQPLHAFDADRIGGSTIVVRRATDGEPVTTLDDVERTLTSDALVIADAERPAVIAGVMGAADVEVTADTTRIVLEAACFDGHSIQRTSRALGLRSESSSRFEKGLDPHTVEVALGFASRMLVEICGATMVPGTIDAQGPEGLPSPPTIYLPGDLPRRVLGIDLSIDEIADTLHRLGFASEPCGSPGPDGVEVRDGEALGWKVEVPANRMHDVTRPIDLVEELGRFRLARIPSELPPITTGGAVLTSMQRVRRLVEDACAGIGLSEVVTYGLVAPGTGVSLGHPADGVIRLANPATVDHAELRTSMVTGHLEVLARNLRAGERDVAIFEVGRTFRPAEPGATGDDGLPRFSQERDALAIMATGSLGGARWDLPGLPTDYPAVAGIVRSVLAAAGVEAVFAPMPNPPSWLHPGQAAQVRAGSADGSGPILGWVAALHPGFAAERGVEPDAFAAHLDLHAIEAARTGTGSVRRFTAFSEFPPVVEDIAVVLADTVRAGDVLAAAREAGGDLLESVDVFDRYVGDPIAADHHSLALRLTFRAADRTLTDAEVAEVRMRIADVLAERFGAQLRS